MSLGFSCFISDSIFSGSDDEQCSLALSWLLLLLLDCEPFDWTALSICALFLQSVELASSFTASFSDIRP